MTRTEFFEAMKFLFALYNKPAPKADVVQAWYPHFEGVTDDVFRGAADKLAMEEERLPTLGSMVRALPGRGPGEPHLSCPYCASGTIRFEFYSEGFGRTYERIMACDCPVGDRRASVKHPKGRMRRYSSMFPIDTAQAGFGMALTRPPPEGDGKGEGFDPDRDKHGGWR